jgi:hypothetical protein
MVFHASLCAFMWLACAIRRPADRAALAASALPPACSERHINPRSTVSQPVTAPRLAGNASAEYFAITPRV